MSKQSKPPPPGDKPTPTAPPPPPGWRHWLWPLALIAALVLFLFLPRFGGLTTVNLSYSTFISDVNAHEVKTFTLDNSTGSTAPATGTLKNGKDYTTVIPLPFAGTPLETTLQNANVEINAAAPSSGLGTELLYWIILLAPFIVVFWLVRRMSRAGAAAGPLGGLMGVGRARAKVFDAERPADQLLRRGRLRGGQAGDQRGGRLPQAPRASTARVGAVGPRGVLMVGPPGTGKTLLARAVAGEAEVPFLALTGSSFVELFVGVGAARVRDLFAEARKQAPPSSSSTRSTPSAARAGGGAIVSNDEREQTLNQLLAEMDGFDPPTASWSWAPPTGPRSWTRPCCARAASTAGRDPAAQPGRARAPSWRCTLPQQAPGRRRATSTVIARGTPGFTGADLANLVNEAAIVAVRQAGPHLITAPTSTRRGTGSCSAAGTPPTPCCPTRSTAVAVHESGHALVAALSPHADPVAKVTILPAGQALGVTEQLPLVERHLYGEDYLNDSLAVRLGGRAAELVVLGQGSTGAANDLASATELAIKMVREFGLSSKLGPVGYPEGGSVFLGGGGPGCPAARTRRPPRPSSTPRSRACSGRRSRPRSRSSAPMPMIWTGWLTCWWRRRRWTAGRCTSCSACPCRSTSRRARPSRRAGRR